MGLAAASRSSVSFRLNAAPARGTCSPRRTVRSVAVDNHQRERKVPTYGTMSAMATCDPLLAVHRVALGGELSQAPAQLRPRVQVVGEVETGIEARYRPLRSH